jgi:hypothetical protein
MAIEVMNRVEKKYIVDTYTCQKLLETIENCTELDSYNKKQDFYTISNLYFDTDDNLLIRRSLSKPKYKEKLRLRSYGVPTEFDRVYLEVKKKYKGIVNKRRTALELTKAYEFLATGVVTPKKYMNKQVLSEIEYFIRLYEPKPKLYLAYDRRAYFGENGLRITLDTNIRTRRSDLKLENGDYGEKLIDDDLWLIEVKTSGAIPLWLTKLLSEYKVYRTSFSKYGTEYKQFIKTKMEGAEKCLNQFLIPQAKLEPSPSPCKAFLSQLA